VIFKCSCTTGVPLLLNGHTDLLTDEDLDYCRPPDEGHPGICEEKEVRVHISCGMDLV
jgi:hypothetical protein